MGWVLVKIPRTQTNRYAQRVPGWRKGGPSLWGLSGYNVKSLIVDHSR